MIVGCLYPGHWGEEIILHKKQRLNKEFLIGYAQQLTKQLQLVRVYVSLPHFHFGQGLRVTSQPRVCSCAAS